MVISDENVFDGSLRLNLARKKNALSETKLERVTRRGERKKALNSSLESWRKEKALIIV